MESFIWLQEWQQYHVKVNSATATLCEHLACCGKNIEAAAAPRERTFKVHSHDAATAMAFLHQWSQSVHTGATMVVATRQSFIFIRNMQCLSNLPLPQPHKMGLEPFYLWHCCCSCYRKCSCE